MTERRGDQGFAVVPELIGGGRDGPAGGPSTPADADGRPAPRLGTLTVHDATTGSILGRYAQFAEDVQSWVVESGGP